MPDFFKTFVKDISSQRTTRLAKQAGMSERDISI
jgi:hypothetical protein